MAPPGTPLADIPEASPTPTPPDPPRPTPGQNSWAQRDRRMERQRLASNAFYQQQVAMAKQKARPLDSMHPAHRHGFTLGDTSPRSPLDDLRNSAGTTMSPFVTAGGQMPASPPLNLTPASPPLNLTPQDSSQAYPTERGVIEDKREQLLHEKSGDSTERTPVFTYTPKLGASEFSKSVGHDTPKKKKGVLDWVTSADQTRSPKKGFLEKLGLTTARPSQPTPAAAGPVGTSRGYGGGESLPPKAKAMLSDSPHNANLGRSPSKKKGLFSRKASENTRSEDTKLTLKTDQQPAGNNEPRSAGTQTTYSDSIGKTPQTGNTAFSDPTHNRQLQSTRAVSQAHSDHGGDKQQKKEENGCGVSRSHSLQYFDRTMPPTPPAKNTPPHEKEKQTKAQQESRRIMEHHQKASEERIRVARNITPSKEKAQSSTSKLTSPLQHRRIFEDDTPTRDTAKLIGADGRTSPTKLGTYGRKEVPTLVKQPSVYSLHADYFPDLNDEWGPVEEVKKRTDGLGLQGLSKLPEKFVKQEPNIMYSPSVYSTDFSPRPGSTSFASPGILHQAGMFRELPGLPEESDGTHPTPSKASLQTKKSGSSKGSIPVVYPDLASDPSRRDLSDGLKTHHRATSDVQLPTHSRKHSRDECLSPPRNSTGMLANLPDQGSLSPPTYNCPSAMPSPLKFLPATTYSPPRDEKAKATQLSPGSERTLTPSRSRGRIEHFKSTGSPIARSVNNSSEDAGSETPKNTGSPTARSLGNPFNNLPSLPPDLQPSVIMPDSPGSKLPVEPQKKLDREPSPVPRPMDPEIAKDVGEEKQAKPDSPKTAALKRLVYAQQEQIASLKATMKATDETTQKVLLNILGSKHSPVASSAEKSDVQKPSASRQRDAEPPVVPPVPRTAADASTMIVSHTSEGTANFDRLPSYVPEGKLDQLGLHHRMTQRRFDQDYDILDAAAIARHELSDEARRAAQGNPDPNALEQVLNMIDGLADRLKNLEQNSKRGA